MLLSIIIPVYNCAPVITRCLKSLDYQEAEIIVIDDGSKDDSAQLVMDYASSHPNVKLFRKDNGGVSSARNMGIENATGKYIMFIDADDYIAPEGIKIAMNLVQSYDADLLKYGYRCVTEINPTDSDIIDINNSNPKVIEGRFSALMRTDVPDFFVWDGIYLRDILEKNGIRFHTDLCLHEDDVFMGEYLCHTRRIVKTDLQIYRFSVLSSCSSTHNQSIERQRNLIESSYRAIHYRSSYVGALYPEAMPLERLKYMRWVCYPKTAINAKYSYKEYKQVLSHFKEVSCWPLDYRWIKVAGLDFNQSTKIKRVYQTFLCNHPRLAYLLLN